MQIYIRRAGFWNSKDKQLSSQFGHIMIYIDKKFYSFTQSEFLNEADSDNCVQIIEPSEFCKTYKGQIWNIVNLSGFKNMNKPIVGYFKNEASKHQYSLKNNCTYECQKALEAGGFEFSKNYIFPGQVLAQLKKRKFSNYIAKIDKVSISCEMFNS